MAGFLPYGGDVLTGIATADNANARQALNGILQMGAQQAWAAAHDKVVDGLRSEIGKPDLIGPGWSLYEIDLRLADDVHLERLAGATSKAGGIPMRLRIAPDLLIAKTTTPSFFGADFDPKFSLDFGIVIDFSLSVVPGQMLLRVAVESAHFTGADGRGDPNFDSQNFTGDMVSAVAELFIPFFGGPNYVSIVESLIGQHDFAGLLNQAIQPLNDALGQLAKEGFGAIVALFPDAAVPSGLSGQSVSIGGQRPIESTPLLVLATPVIGDGAISGAIRWSKDAGSPALEPPFIGAFAITATVDRRAEVGGFRQATDVTHLESWESADTDTEYIIRYRLGGLPIDEPIKIESGAVASVPWTGKSSGMKRSVEPDGWAGPITVHEGIDIAQRLDPEGLANNRVHQGAAGGAGEEVELNPQPIPPGREMRGPGAAGAVGEQVELNSQPIPPGREMRGPGAAVNAAWAAGKGGRHRIIEKGALEGEISIGAAEAERLLRERPFAQDPSGAGTVTNIDFRVETFTIK